MTFEFEPGRLRGGEERDPWWFVVDPILILSVAAITAMGTLLVFSATRGPATELIPADTSFLERQVFFAIAGAAMGGVAAIVNIERIRSLVSAGYLGFIALISISLAVLNLLPVPMLDGGHLLYYAVEALIGRPIPERIQYLGLQVGLVFLVGIMLLAFYNDLLRL